MRNYLKNLAFHYEGNQKEMLNALKRKATVKEFSCDYEFVTIIDKDYPKQLLDLYDPPIVLFYSGNLELLKNECVSVVGSRRPNQYAIEETKILVKSLKERYCIVSGLAYGIDCIAHLESKDTGTIAVIANGLDIYYPKEHQTIQKYLCRKQLVLTEYPPQTKAKKHHFPVRNRVIAALSKKILIMAGTEKSGTMHTANIALELNRQVYCLPHNVNEVQGKACNQLIQEGASVLTKENEFYTI
ncbi:DNA-processing protein DprA [Erysipelothrix urinaevulpis]|uniref:DNA-processing protein DprA n=1 Tax=Erysipelothrix urinaevulpis TaxID=2683717 RepID=UPI00135972DE|nr:DNA-processing protein DprA [Erysipelothrix urinaevulpis]